MGLENDASIPVHVHVEGIAMSYAADDYFLAQGRSYEPIYGTA